MNVRQEQNLKRRDRELDRETADHPVIVFDGICNLCNALVSFVIRRDPEMNFRFAASQSDAGEDIIKRPGRNSPDFDSVMLVEDGHATVKSDAVLRIAALLGGPWKLTGFFRIIPRRIRDFLYDFIAAHRYHWFGTCNACPMPDDDTRRRFLEFNNRITT